jgi:DNA primase
MKSTLDELLDRVNILDIISEYVQLRKAGRNYVGLCPFHKEKTPSFSVSTEKQIYYCFGCKEGGNAVNFLMKYENQTFQEALEGLAGKYGVQIEKRGGTKRATVFDALAKLTDYYQQNLRNSQVALRYLRDRGIDDNVVSQFKIGFSERSRLRVKAFVKDSGVPMDILLSTGVLRVKDGETYDIFGGRVVFPIIDANKKVVGFGGRGPDKESFPKYINSPESSVFAKRQVLYGIDKARKYIGEKNEAVIVEGYFDLISLYACGFRNVVATLGTSVTEEQLVRLRNYTEHVTVMLDGDEAGIRSALKLIPLFSQLDINGSMVVLPEGHDPDSFVRERGSAGVEALMAERKPILDFFFEYHRAHSGVERLEGKMNFIRKVMPHVEAIRDQVRKRLYVKRLSELTNVEESHFFDTMKEEKRGVAAIAEGPHRIINKRVVNALINNPSLLSQFRGKGVMEQIEDHDLKEIVTSMCEYYEDKSCLDVQSYIASLGKEELREFVLTSVFDDAGSDGEELERIVWDYVHHINKEYVLAEARRITEGLSDAEKRGDQTAITELLDRKRQVLAMMKSSLNTVR